MTISREDCLRLDAEDQLAWARDRFLLPDGLVYLDGNSLGPLQKGVQQALDGAVSEEWGRDLIRSWNQHDWIGLPARVGEKIAPLIGAAPGQVIAADSTSINVFKMLSAAMKARPDRRIILSNRQNFPTDLYMAEGLASLLTEGRCELRWVDSENVEEMIGDDVAVVMLTHVDFRTGKMFDMERMTRAAHEAGALMLWDLAHSAGALPVFLDDCKADLAVGCGYKYLNGGPGAPAFLYVASRHQSLMQQPLSGWMGHAAPFDFDPAYHPAPGIEHHLCGTPSVLAMKALDRAMDIWSEVDLGLVRKKSIALSELFIQCIETSPELGDLKLASPRNAEQRGSQVSFSHPQGYAVMQALIAAGVIGDFREPDLLRFGFTPLYTRFSDVWDAVDELRRIVATEEYRDPAYGEKSRVT